MAVRGLRNATWRTPGHDVGRDIEGEVAVTDLLGFVRTERWYVDCKRYRRTVDWPTVHEKLAYAQNHDVDVLFICTTGFISPQCKDEIARHNTKQRRPRIEYWDAPRLDQFVPMHAELVWKYHLEPSNTRLSFRANSALLGDLVRASDALVASTAGSSAEREATFVRCLSELLSTHLSDSNFPSVEAVFRPDRAPDWLSLNTPTTPKMHQRTLLTILAFIRMAERKPKLSVETVTPSRVKIPLSRPLSKSGQQTLTRIALLGSLGVSVSKTTVTVEATR